MCKMWPGAINEIVKSVKFTEILTIVGILTSFNISSNRLFAIHSVLSVSMKHQSRNYGRAKEANIDANFPPEN